MVGTTSCGYSNSGRFSEGEYSMPFFCTRHSPRKKAPFIHTKQFSDIKYDYDPHCQMWCFEVITAEKALIPNFLLLLGLISLLQCR